MTDNIVDMFPEYRLKIKLVSRVKIGRNRLRITVNHNGFIPSFSSCQYAVYATVIKFNPLTNSVRSRAQYHYFLFVAYHTLVVHIRVALSSFHGTFKSGIVIRCLGCKFSSTGIHQLIHTVNVHRISLFVYLTFQTTQHMGNLPVAIPFLLGF